MQRNHIEGRGCLVHTSVHALSPQSAPQREAERALKESKLHGLHPELHSSLVLSSFDARPCRWLGAAWQRDRFLGKEKKHKVNCSVTPISEAANVLQQTSSVPRRNPNTKPKHMQRNPNLPRPTPRLSLLCGRDITLHKLLYHHFVHHLHTHLCGLPPTLCHQ